MDSYENRPQSSRDTYLAVVLLILVGIPLFVFFNIITSGLFINMLLAAGGLGVLGSIHYFLWGRALTNNVAAERDAQETVEGSIPEEWQVGTSAESRHIGPL